MSATERPTVSVVGGGLAGLSAAIACADGGATVELFEARPRLGGATWSFTRNGLAYDNGQHVYLRCCTAYQRFLERLDTAALAPIAGALALPVYAPAVGGGAPRRAVLSRSNLPAPLHLSKALLSYSHIGTADRLRLGRVLRSLSALSLNDPTLDGESFGAFLRRNGQSERVIHALFDVIVLPTTNLRSDDVSLALAAKVFKTGLLEENDAADIGWAQAPLSEVHVDPARRVLERLGGTVRIRTKVEALAVDGSRPAIVVDGTRIESDAVIVATPSEAAAALLDPVLPESARVPALESEPIIDLHFVFDRRVVSDSIAAAINSPVQYIFDRTVASGLEGPGQCIAVSVSGAESEIGERPEPLRARYLDALGAIYPAVRDAEVIDFVVSREHDATFRGLPGSAQRRRNVDSGLPGVFLAGAWTDTGWPATMEGAVRSGNRAAWRALVATGQRRGLPELEEAVA